MSNSYFLKRVFITLTLCLLFASFPSFAQNVITITDDQPFIEGFEGGVFDLWTVDSTGGGHWSVVNGSESSVASFSYDNIGEEARLISPVLNFTSVGAATVTFSYAMMGVYAADVLEVCYRTSETDSWHVLNSFSVSDFTNAYEAICNLPNLSSTYQISFNAQGLGGIILFLDNVEVASVFSCSRPIGLEANNITNTSALLSWSTTGNEDSWTIELNGVETVVTTQPFLMQGLTPQTQYTFRVKANCGNDSESDWSLPIVFTSFCDVYVVTDDVPFFDDFESSEEFVCWQTEIISGVDNWTIDPGYLIHNNTAFLIWLGGEARLISLPMDLTAVTVPALSFKHKQPQWLSVFDEMSVWYRTSLEDEWHSIQEYAYPADELETELITLPNPSSTYQISFVGTCHNGGGLYVDDVKVGKKSVVGIEERSDFTVYVTPNPTKGLVVITSNMTNGEAVVYDMFGKQVSATAVVNGSAEFDLGNCANGIYVVRLIGAEGVHTVKLVKE